MATLDATKLGEISSMADIENYPFCEGLIKLMKIPNKSSQGVKETIAHTQMDPSVEENQQ